MMLAKVKEQGRDDACKSKGTRWDDACKSKGTRWDDACTEQVKLACVVSHACLTDTPSIE